MICSVSNDGNERSLDFGPVSVPLTVKDFIQEMTKCSQEHCLASWSFLLFERHDFLNVHLARVPVTPNQQESMEMRDGVFSSVSAQEMDISGFQVADLEDFEFHWDDLDLNMYAVFLPGMNTPFTRSNSENFELGSTAEKPILVDEEQHEENSPLLPTNAVSKRPTQRPVLIKNHPFRTRIENNLDYFRRNFFLNFLY